MSKHDWVKEKWRPAMGWMYMVVCIMDFVVFPILWSLAQAYYGGSITSQWNPTTLQFGGIFHLAMGAVLGVSAWSRGQEKLAGQATSYPQYNQNQQYNQPTIQQPPLFTSRTGKHGPVIEEPLL